MKIRTTLFSALMFASFTAFAFHCPADMKAIDAKLATGVKMTDANRAKVKQLRADGETAHKAGNHAESLKLLAEAKKILGIQERGRRASGNAVHALRPLAAYSRSSRLTPSHSRTKSAPKTLPGVWNPGAT